MGLLKAAVLVAILAVCLYFARIYFAGCVYQGTSRMDGKTVVITGANTGIGLETAIELAARGAKVVMACRNEEKCQTARQHVLNLTASEKVTSELLDLSSLKSIRAFAERLTKSEKRLDVLINNAGVMALPDFTETEDGFEMTFGVNHLGHFYLTHLLLDLIKKSAPSRIVIVSSSAHSFANIDFDDIELRKENAYGPWVSYGNSKMANILYARELATRLKGTGVTAVSLHPGAIATELQRHVPLLEWAIYLSQFLLVKTPWEGSQTTLHCAIDASVVNDNGKYFSDCYPKTPVGVGEDDAAAKKLWEISMKMLKL